MKRASILSAAVAVGLSAFSLSARETSCIVDPGSETYPVSSASSSEMAVRFGPAVDSCEMQATWLTYFSCHYSEALLKLVTTPSGIILFVR